MQPHLSTKAKWINRGMRTSWFISSCALVIMSTMLVVKLWDYNRTTSLAGLRAKADMRSLAYDPKHTRSKVSRSEVVAVNYGE